MTQTPNELRVDFVNGPVGHRLRFGGGRGQDLPKAMGLRAGKTPTIIDATAGLGRDAFLLDPMHPPRKNSALVKRELRQVRDLVGTDDDAADLVRVALATARQRVVLKWPAKADPIEGVRACSHQILGKSTRYDVFMLG